MAPFTETRKCRVLLIVAGRFQRSWVLALAAGVLLALPMASCGGTTRSAAAVCHVFATDGVAFHDHYQHVADSMNSSNVFGSIADLASVPGRMAELLSKMDAVAPKDVEPAFASLASTFQQMASSEAQGALHPLSGLASSLALALTSQGAFDEVNAYLTKHCGPRR